MEECKTSYACQVIYALKEKLESQNRLTRVTAVQVAMKIYRANNNNKINYASINTAANLALRKLQSAGAIYRIGRGIYGKTEKV